MKIPLPEYISSLQQWFSATGKPLYVVGGYVRNALLGLPQGDIDVCAALPPEKLESIANEEFSITERSYGLGTVVINQKRKDARQEYEYTAFRRDSYGRGGEHRPEKVYFTQDIAEDAARRDFTINALYADKTGQVTDPLGLGLSDIKARLIRMCMPDTLSQDALRVLRMVRFSAQLGFAAEAGTYAAAGQNIQKLADISKERIREEFFKILMADSVYGNTAGVLDGLRMLKDIGALQYILPELLKGEGMEQSKRYHKYDVMEHNMRSCAAAPPDITVRLAALLHDIEKPGAWQAEGNMYSHPKMGAQTAAEILHRLRAGSVLTDNVAQLVKYHMFDLDNRAKKSAVTRMIVKLGKEQFLRLCELREADYKGSGRGAEPESAVKWRAILRDLEKSNAPLNRNSLAVNGDDIMKELGIGPGKQVGMLLNRLHEYSLKKPAQNNYKSLIRYAKMIFTDKLGDTDVKNESRRN